MDGQKEELSGIFPGGRTTSLTSDLRVSKQTDTDKQPHSHTDGDRFTQTDTHRRRQTTQKQGSQKQERREGEREKKTTHQPPSKHSNHFKQAPTIQKNKQNWCVYVTASPRHHLGTE